MTPSATGDDYTPSTETLFPRRRRNSSVIRTEQRRAVEHLKQRTTIRTMYSIKSASRDTKMGRNRTRDRQAVLLTLAS